MPKKSGPIQLTVVAPDKNNVTEQHIRTAVNKEFVSKLKDALSTSDNVSVQTKKEAHSSSGGE